MKQYVQKNYRNLRYSTGTGTTDDPALILGAVPVATGLSDQFTIKVSNKDTSPVAVALLTGHYDTAMYDTILDTSDPNYDPNNPDSFKFITVKSLCNPQPLKDAGYTVDACADDGSYGLINFSSTDKSKTIRSFHDYMHLNPRPLKGLQVIAPNAAAFDTTMMVTASNPFQKPAEKEIHLIDFFSAYQYQNDRIMIDFSANELEISDITMLIVNIPASTDMSFVMKF
jgi:hypothetical protein